MSWRDTFLRAVWAACVGFSLYLLLRGLGVEMEWYGWLGLGFLVGFLAQLLVEP
jgi:hypothetical protein